MFPTCKINPRSIVAASRTFHRSCTICQKDTVDKSEIDHFVKLSEDWWNPNGKMRPLMSMNDLRVPFVRDGLVNTKVIDEEKGKTAKYLEGLKILDVGCGGGFFSVPLSRLGADVTGIDPTHELVQVARAYVEKNLPEAKIKFENSTIEEHAASNGDKYDVLVCSEVIEHVSAKESFVKSCVSTVKPGGSLFYTTISQTFLAWFLAIIVAENIIRLPPKGTHQYEKLITPRDLTRILEGAGSRVLTINGMQYNPFNNRWYWCPNKSVNYALHAVKSKKT
ncbi:Nodulation protein S (NodS) [Nesidiocoris tenuis]|uniref:Ubiquinone biosynthesis O-methyltransferase, mitochondrial n=1 Tax=Nesidiocoris tenuis TaxID=355587 RepID=A0ABN7AQ16_9HEMI|nr:Nodulation protein S (NodS) [Nesidiocoris tenuis]